jgi:hypothetical protein
LILRTGERRALDPASGIRDSCHQASLYAAWTISVRIAEENSSSHITLRDSACGYKACRRSASTDRRPDFGRLQIGALTAAVCAFFATGDLIHIYCIEAPFGPQMELKTGDKLGPDEIVAVIGKGGMGEVWRARDPRLNRDVAIKVSAQQFSDRFEREARALAALNHPNICTLFDVGPNYLVMEPVEGSTLAERIAQGPIPQQTNLPYCRFR